MTASFTPTAAELRHLRRCVELATEALEAGDEPFGSVLVAADGTVLAEDHNRVASGDRTRHPEFELARWAAANMTPEERAAATVFTSGEHCPMCAAAHGWVGLGRIVYVSSSEQLASWLDRARSPLTSRAQLGNPGDRPRSFGGGSCSRRSPSRCATCTVASTAQREKQKRQLTQMNSIQIRPEASPESQSCAMPPQPKLAEGRRGATRRWPHRRSARARRLVLPINNQLSALHSPMSIFAPQHPNH